MASKSSVANIRRTRRSERETKQEININELSKKKPQGLNGKASYVGGAADGECFFDLARVKVEPKDENTQVNEDTSNEFEFSLSVDLNTVKREQENDLRYPYVLLNDCQNSKIELEAKQHAEISESNATVDLNKVKNEQKNDVKYPLVLLKDCLNPKIKLEPKSDGETSDPLTTVDLNTVKNGQEKDVKYPLVLLEDCLNPKIKLEPKSDGETSDSLTTVDLNTVKNEQENDVRYPLVLLNDCLNYKIKLEPKSDGELSDQFTTVDLNTVKNEEKPKTTRRSKRNHVKVAYETETDVTHIKKMLRSSTALTPRIKYEAFDGRTKWEPPNWEDVVTNIRKMRQERNAPIDIWGPRQWMDKGENPQVSRYQTFVSLLLSSKTRDAINYEAMTRLRKHGLTVDQILATDETTIGTLIAPVSFWKTKARQLLRATALLRERHADDVPKSVAALIALPGVGPKMAHNCMSHVWGKTTGIGVGSFTHRVAVRLGWSWASDPDRTRLALESWLPRKLWPEINELLVGFGQQTCQAREPQCHQCLVAAKLVCPSAPLSLYFQPE